MKVVVTIMEWLIGLFVFCLVLFIYLHVTFQLRTSNDLEVYEIDEPSKDKLEEIIPKIIKAESSNSPLL